MSDNTVGRMIHTRAKKEWLYDVSWSWSDSLPVHGKAAVRQKSQSLTLKMTHNPTRISVIKAKSFVQIKRDKTSHVRSRFLLELLVELQKKLLCHQIEAV
jgi:hypothetical protein